MTSCYESEKPLACPYVLSRHQLIASWALSRLEMPLSGTSARGIADIIENISWEKSQTQLMTVSLSLCHPCGYDVREYKGRAEARPQHLD